MNFLIKLKKLMKCITKFTASGLMIVERNYLDVYPYDKWSDKEIPVFKQGDSFTPADIEVNDFCILNF